MITRDNVDGLAIVGVFSLVVGMLLLIPVSAIIHGFVLVKLWAWFAVPIFHVSELNIPQAIGLSLVFNLFKGGSTSASKQGKELATALVGSTLIAPFFVLGIGYIVKGFM